jgi:hypothetical protein
MEMVRKMEMAWVMKMEKEDGDEERRKNLVERRWR